MCLQADWNNDLPLRLAEMCDPCSQASCVRMFVFKVPPTAKVIWRRGYSLVSFDRRIKPLNPGLQGEWFIYYTTTTPTG